MTTWVKKPCWAVGRLKTCSSQFDEFRGTARTRGVLHQAYAEVTGIDTVDFGGTRVRKGRRR